MGPPIQQQGPWERFKQVQALDPDRVLQAPRREARQSTCIIRLVSKHGYKHALAALRERWPSAELLSEDGGNSWVFEVSDGKPLALKVLRRSEPERYARFREELKLAERLSGIKNVVTPEFSQLPSEQHAYSGCSISTLAFYGMRLFPDGTAAGKHLVGPSVDGGWKAIRAIIAISLVLKRIHDLGLAHRDLKPENILVDERGNYWISDFGQGIDLATAEERGFVTLEDEVVGAFWYRASEYLRGRLGKADHRRGDVFSMGRMLWAFLRGAHPIGLTDIEFAEAKISMLVPTLRRGPLLDQLISDATHPLPESRPTIKDFIDVLEDWMDDSRPGSPERIRELIARDANAIEERARAKSKEELNAALAQSQKYVGSQLGSKDGLGAYLTALGDGSANVSGGGPPVIDRAKTLIPIPHACLALIYTPKSAMTIIPFVSLAYRAGFTLDRQKIVDEVIACVVEYGKEPVYWLSDAGEFSNWNAAAIAKANMRLRDATAWALKFFEKLGS